MIILVSVFGFLIKEEGEQDDDRHDLDGKLLPEKHHERKAQNDRDDTDFNRRGVFLLTSAGHGYKPQGFTTPSMTIPRTTSISTVHWYLRGAPQAVAWFRTPH